MKKNYLILCAAILLHLNASAQAVWTQKANYPGTGSAEFRAFSVNDKVYIAGPTAAIWEYDPASDIWTQKANLLGTQRASPVAFAIGTKGYMGTGGGLNDFYEYDQPSNTWTQKSNFGGVGREGALGIAINGKGYAGTGGNYLNDWWEYDPATDAWTQKANLAGPGRYHGGAFTIGGYGYVCTGFNGTFMNDNWQFDPLNNTWSAKASMPGTTRDRPVGFAIGNKGYIATGWTGSVSKKDCWEYDAVSDSWTQMPDFGGLAGYNFCAAATSNKAYVGIGVGIGSEWWEFGNVCSAQFLVTDATCFSACNGVAAATQPDSNAVASYLWSGGQTVSTLTGLCPGTYTLTLTDTSGCVSVNNVVVNSLPPMLDTYTSDEPDCNGGSDGSICISVTNGVAPYSYLWFNGNTSDCINNMAAGSYNVVVTDASGCTQSFNALLSEPAAIVIATSHQDATCPTCNNGSAAASITGGVGPFSYLWSNGSTSAFLPSLLPGTYTICVTDANNCSTCTSLTIGDLTGLLQLTDDDVKLNPNPFSDYLNFELPLTDIENAEIVITDATGRVAYTSKFTGHKFSINTATLSKGIYQVLITTEKWIYKKKLIKSFD